MIESAFKQEIAYAAARLIAEDGLDYEYAKKKALNLVLGNQRLPRGASLPTNLEIEDAVREYQALYLADTQPQRLAELRRVALEVMTFLSSFNPYLVGPVWTGTAGEHSLIFLQCFTDSAKDLEIFLLNQDIPFDVIERPDFRGRGLVEAVYFDWQNEEVVASVYDEIALRGALKPGANGLPERASIQLLTQFLQGTP